MSKPRFAIVLAGAAIAALVIVPKTGSSQPTAPTAAPVVKQLPAVQQPIRPATPAAASILGRQTLPPIRLTTPPLVTVTDVGGQMVGAGANVIVTIGEDGKPQRTFPTKIGRPSISPHGTGALVVGNLADKTVSTFDLKTGAVTELLKLRDVKDPATNAFPGRHVLDDGALASVASDGSNVFVAIEAGFSSAIFKVDPKTKQIVERAWATAPDPQAMVFANGGLFVLVGEGKQVRRFTEKLERSLDNIDLPSPVKGLGVRNGEIRGLLPASPQVQRITVDAKELSRHGIVAKLDKVNPVQVPFRQIKPPPINFPKRYAVLITGDLAENFSGECFWNDTVWMYKSLIANGYDPDDIFVLYGDGVDYVSANPAYRHPTPVSRFAATTTNVNTVLNGLKNGDPMRGIPKMDDNDTLFVWTFDHGGRTSSGESTLCLRNGWIGADAFAAKLNALAYQSRAVFMQQCYSGGFINPLKNAKTFISTAAKADEVARPADTENETYAGKVYTHGEFNYHITSALDRRSPTGASVNADYNWDTFVSAFEMHKWNVAKESRPETPQSNDMGGIGNLFKFKK